MDTSSENMEPQRQALKPVTPLSLGRYHISEEYGFLLQNPLKELPSQYRPWMEIARELPHLIESHQLRAHVYKMPLLDCRFLKGHREQRLAHLVLAAITMGFVWQEGETQPPKVLPRALAIPLAEVSGKLGLPPILIHSDLVLANWTKRNPEGPWEISNLETIISFPGEESLQAFVLVTVLVEKAATPGIKALVLGVEALLQHNQDTLLQALQQLRLSIQDMAKVLVQMQDYVDPDIFYTVIRIFLSGASHIPDRVICAGNSSEEEKQRSLWNWGFQGGEKMLIRQHPTVCITKWDNARWKDNPAIPEGLVYEGVATEPLRYSGGSAAQSSVLQAFDEFLGIRHCKGSGFLHRMRDYMPPSHKAFLEDLHSAPSLRDHVLTSGAGCCLMAYNQCVEALAQLRSYHINVVARYIISAASRARMLSHPSPHALEDRGTGGTAVLSFLKSVREKTVEAILHPNA